MLLPQPIGKAVMLLPYELWPQAGRLLRLDAHPPVSVQGDLVPSASGQQQGGAQQGGAHQPIPMPRPLGVGSGTASCSSNSPAVARARRGIPSATSRIAWLFPVIANAWLSSAAAIRFRAAINSASILHLAVDTEHLADRRRDSHGGSDGCGPPTFALGLQLCLLLHPTLAPSGARAAGPGSVLG